VAAARLDALENDNAEAEGGGDGSDSEYEIEEGEGTNETCEEARQPRDPYVHSTYFLSSSVYAPNPNAIENSPRESMTPR
jgi:hypothetical protein